VTQERIAKHHEPGYQPFFWVREASGASAEVDLLLHINQQALPVEVKAGTSGRLRSLHSFIDRSQTKVAVRLLRNKSSREEAKTPAGTDYTLVNVPYYAASEIEEYIENDSLN